MSIFMKKPAASLPLPERCKAVRAAVYAAMQENAVSGLNAAALLEDMAKWERMRVATVAPLASANPRVTSGNVKPTLVDDLRELIAGR